MSIELPPPATPQLGTIEQLQQQAGSGVVVAFQNYQMHIAAAGIVDEATLNKVVAAADSISNAVRNIGSAAYLAGFPAAQVLYVASGQDVYVVVKPGEISSVRANDALRPYLAGLESSKPLTDRALESHRVLASMLTDRAGYDIYPVFEPDGNGGQVLDLEKNVKKHDPTQINIDFGNPGNRFASRYFLDLGIKTATVYGDEFRVAWREGFPNVDTATGGDYHEQNASWNRVTPYGVFGLGGRHVDYSYTAAAGASTVPLLGRIWVVEGIWLYPIFADFTSRWTAQGKVDYTDKKGELDRTATTTALEIQREKYTSLEAATSYAHNFQFLSHQWTYEGGLTARKGLGDNEKTTLPAHANEGYLLFRGTSRMKFYWTSNLLIGAEVSGQFSNDTLPEQQQWVLGGQGNITSALPGVTAGDKGYVARAFTELGIPAQYGEHGIAGLEFRPRVFIEQGASQYESPQAGQANGSQRLLDAGLEIGFKYLQWFDGSVAYARDISYDNINAKAFNDANARMYFKVGVKY